MQSGTIEPGAADAPLTLPLDISGERAQARVRVTAAWLAMAAGIWLAAVDAAVWLRVTALTSVAFSVRWLMVQRAARAALSDPTQHYLEITREHLVIAEGSSQRTIARQEIRAIELDEDRLVVVVRLLDGQAQTIEPRYGKLGPRELGETLVRVLCVPAHRDARS